VIVAARFEVFLEFIPCTSLYKKIVYEKPFGRGMININLDDCTNVKSRIMSKKISPQEKFLESLNIVDLCITIDDIGPIVVHSPAFSQMDYASRKRIMEHLLLLKTYSDDLLKLALESKTLERFYKNINNEYFKGDHSPSEN
jgi:hypothetical protein